MHLKLWDPKPSRGFDKETRDIAWDIDMWHDMARKLWHGTCIQHCNKASELVLIDLQTRRKGREMQHMPATPATHRFLSRLSSGCSGLLFPLSLAPLSLGSGLLACERRHLRKHVATVCQKCGGSGIAGGRVAIDERPG